MQTLRLTKLMQPLAKVLLERLHDSLEKRFLPQQGMLYLHKVGRYQDVCVVLNPANVKAWHGGSFRDINAETRNKLYVACSRARGNLTFIPEFLLKAYKRS